MTKKNQMINSSWILKQWLILSRYLLSHVIQHIQVQWTSSILNHLILLVKILFFSLFLLKHLEVLWICNLIAIKKDCYGFNNQLKINKKKKNSLGWFKYDCFHKYNQHQITNNDTRKRWLLKKRNLWYIKKKRNVQAQRALITNKKKK